MIVADLFVCFPAHMERGLELAWAVGGGSRENNTLAGQATTTSTTSTTPTNKPTNQQMLITWDLWHRNNRRWARRDLSVQVERLLPTKETIELSDDRCRTCNHK